MEPDLSTSYYKRMLSENLIVGIEEAIFRDETFSHWIIKFKIGTEGALLEWEKVRKEGNLIPL